MTSLQDLERHSGGDGEKLPGFTFKRIGDAVKGIIIRSALVDVDTDYGKRTKLVVELEVDKAKGGKPIVDSDGIMTGVDDYAAGEKCAVWLTPQGISAVTAAVRPHGTDLLDGGTLTVTLAERKDTGKAKPLNVYTAAYVPPVGGTSLGVDDPPF